MEEKCIVETRTTHKWDSGFNEKAYQAMRSFCDVTGKGCKSAEDFKERHTTKIETVHKVCN